MRANMVPFLVLLFLCQRISAAEDLKIITAESGQKSVTLTCRAPNNSKNLIGVEWNRADLKEEYVLLYRDEQFVPDYQHPSFKNRVDLNDTQMKDGDVSLILKDVITADDGIYVCRVLIPGTKRRKRTAETVRSIRLSVVPPGQTGGHTEDGGKEDGGKEDGSVGLIVGLSVAAVVIVATLAGFLIYRKKKSQSPYQLPAEL
ncbi:uncharacterized protein LOC113019550 [Astatotilapia calliptera]|uniref:uncharacterized protein LOC113019550 n=1 Tax=Astatotilapia calliptera TaxID=8154 RepID=UPI000E411C60|nr:uncharacterized protein LOC113019550 [Astatotilapia calliptera]